MNKSRTQMSPRKEHIIEEEGRCYNIYPRKTFTYNNNTFWNRAYTRCNITNTFYL
jgi:hypothetical protein